MLFNYVQRYQESRFECYSITATATLLNSTLGVRYSTFQRIPSDSFKSDETCNLLHSFAILLFPVLCSIIDLAGHEMITCWRSLFRRLCSQEVVNLKPVHEGIKPFIAGAVWISEAEAVAAVLVKVKFYRSTCFEPRLNYAELTTE